MNGVDFVGSVIQVFAFWMFFVLLVNKVNDTLSEGVSGLEAPLANYDSKRWGEEDGQVFFEVKDEKESEVGSVFGL
jgi:hypothetical protein